MTLVPKTKRSCFLSSVLVISVIAGSVTAAEACLCSPVMHSDKIEGISEAIALP